MSRPAIPAATRAAAVADFHASGQTYAAVARRHGVSSTALHSWIHPKKNKRGGGWTWRDEEVAYSGSAEFDPTAWEVRNGVLYPLFPERRSA